MIYFMLAIFLLILGGLLSTFLNNKFKLKFCTFFAGIASVCALIPAFTSLIKGEVIKQSFVFSPLYGTVNFVIDPLSAFFIIIISIMSFLGLVYANGYLKPYIEKGKSISSHSFFLMLLIASMLGVVTVQNGLFFLVIWELMSLSSFFLVIFEGEKKEVRKAGIKYLVYMHLSVLLIISMFAMLTNISNSLDFTRYAEAIRQNQHYANLAFILGFIGFGIKAGFVPFHNWLPDAHPAAPSHVSGIMSGVMIKTGIYGILRILFLIGVPTKGIAYLVLIVALLTLLYGVLYAITQHDLKRLLAYSSIENIGIIGLGIAIGMLGLAYNNPVVAIFGLSGGILHILNHSIFKEILFFSAGNTYIKTHTRNIETLGGLVKNMPHTSLLFILGSIAICGLPPFNGFISEILIYAGMLFGIPASEINLFIMLVISIASLAMVGTMAIVCFSKATGITFLGEPRSEHAKDVDSDVDKIMILPISILAVLALSIGLFPQAFIKLALSPVTLFINTTDLPSIFNSLGNFMQVLSIIFLIFIFILAVVAITKRKVSKQHTCHTTWGCGYDRPNSHMQYTPSSFDNLFVSTLKPLFKRVSHIKKPKDLFPKEAYFELEIEDIEEAYIVEPIIKLDEKILAKFERIQNGNMQQYILFGLIFLVLAIAGLMIFG